VWRGAPARQGREKMKTRRLEKEDVGGDHFHRMVIKGQKRDGRIHIIGSTQKRSKRARAFGWKKHLGNNDQGAGEKSSFSWERGARKWWSREGSRLRGVGGQQVGVWREGGE